MPGAPNRKSLVLDINVLVMNFGRTMADEAYEKPTAMGGGGWGVRGGGNGSGVNGMGVNGSRVGATVGGDEVGMGP